jgi:hypothetical protein
MKAFLAIVGSLAIAAGIIATGMLIAVFIRSNTKGIETFGAEFVIIPCFFAASIGCFSIAWLCFYRPDRLTPQFSLRNLLVVVTLVAIVMGMIVSSWY